MATEWEFSNIYNEYYQSTNRHWKARLLKTPQVSIIVTPMAPQHLLRQIRLSFERK